MFVGITGHQNISDSCSELVRTDIDRILAKTREPLIGLTSLAAGADQIFAEAMLDHGGQLHVVLPSENIEASFSDQAARDAFRALLGRATATTKMPFAEPGEEAYWAAGRAIADGSDLLLAVWDGESAGGLGGTADVVLYARERGKDVEIIWPEGCTRG